jgi:hypothetical protein
MTQLAVDYFIGRHLLLIILSNEIYDD